MCRLKGLSARSLFGNWQLDHAIGLWEVGKGRALRLISYMAEKQSDPIYAYFIDIENAATLVAEVLAKTNVDLDGSGTDAVKIAALKKWIVGDSTATGEAAAKNEKCKFAVAGGVEFGTNDIGVVFARGMVVFLVHKSQAKLALTGSNDIITVLVS